MIQTILTFIKTRIFYRVSMEEKNYVRTNVMKNDHPIFLRLLLTVFGFQFAMIVYQCISSGFQFDSKDIKYLACYAILAFICLIFYPISDYLNRKGKPLAYFTVVSFSVLAFTLWSCAIVFIDSSAFTTIDGKNIVILVTYAYVTLTLSSIIILEPWVFILDMLIGGLFLNAHLALFQTGGVVVPVVVTTVSITLLCSIATCVNFVRRIDAINLSKEVIDLNILFKTNAYVDDLTKIYNRRYLTERIDSPLRFGDRPSATIMMDIDNFKHINDEYGHQNGDVILSGLGRIIKNQIREIPESYAVRYGGEEFLIYVAHSNKESIIELAEKIRKEVEDKEFELIDGSVIHITISLGASIATPGINYTNLINTTDTNLYEAKHAGKNRTHFE